MNSQILSVANGILYAIENNVIYSHKIPEFLHMTGVNKRVVEEAAKILQGEDLITIEKVGVNQKYSLNAKAIHLKNKEQYFSSYFTEEEHKKELIEKGRKIQIERDLMQIRYFKRHTIIMTLILIISAITLLLTIFRDCKV